MIERPIWSDRLKAVWKAVPIVWLSGVRRVGKTSLVKQLPEALFLNCDLPSTEERVRDPERFFGSVPTELVIFDEIHQLEDPSSLLKIAADEFSHLRVLATGSSTLDATKKFRDSLTGRKRNVTLRPVLFEELEAFKVKSLEERLFRGGLPPALLVQEHDPEFYSEWMDSYFARDVQELFHLEKREAFLKCLRLLLRQSGGLIDLSSVASDTSVSRPTIMSWMNIFQITHTLRIVRPFAKGGRREIVAQPKVYGFDTGFVCFTKAIESSRALRSDDCGLLWEHLVLDTLESIKGAEPFFWRDKQHREIDFVVPKGQTKIHAIECKWSVSAFDPPNLQVFRKNYSQGTNFVVSPEVTKGTSFRRRYAGLEIHFVPLEELRGLLA
jgi:predicted AAA+ superfamily ATPase